MVAKPRSKARKPVKAQATTPKAPATTPKALATKPAMKTIRVKVGGVSLKIRVGVVTIPPGTYADRAGPSGGHIISPLEKGVTRITRTTSGARIAAKVDRLELASGDPLWVPDTPKGVTVRIENTSSKMVVFGKIYPPEVEE